MSITTRIKTLLSKHKSLDAELHNAYMSRLPATEIARIKKLKLKLKDDINSMLSSLNNMENAA